MLRSVSFVGIKLLVKLMSIENKFKYLLNELILGVNFNVRTCESCKVFFRRNALHYEVLDSTSNKN